MVPTSALRASLSMWRKWPPPVAGYGFLRQFASTAAKRYDYFKDRLDVPLKTTAFVNCHDFRKYNRVAAKLIRNIDRETVSVTVRDVRNVDVDVLSASVDVGAMVKCCGTSFSQLSGKPVELRPEFGAYSSMMFTGTIKVTEFESRAGAFKCELLIQDKPPGFCNCGSSFSVRCKAPSYVTEKLLHAVDHVATSEAYYATVLRGKVKRALPIPNPGLYFPVLARSVAADFLILLDKTLSERGLFKSIPSTSPDILDSDSSLLLTQSQEEIIERVLKQPLTLVQGPPGTGKTLVAGAVVARCKKRLRQMSSQSKIMMMAPSNVGSDNLARVAREHGLRVVRFLSHQYRTKENYEVPDDILEISSENFVLQMAENEGFGDRRAFLEMGFNGQLTSGGDQQKYLQIRSILEMKVLREADVVVTTCMGSASRIFDKVDFQLILVDEATQAIEPEVLLAVSRCPLHLVLFGDQCQLGPTAETSLSLFERLVMAGHQPSLLNIQYRMHPKLIHFSNRVMYNSLLQSGIRAEDRLHTTNSFPWPNRNSPLLFIAVSGELQKTSAESYLNKKEASWTADVAEELVVSGACPSSIGVITPYSSQRRLIRSTLRQRSASTVDQIEVCSVDEFQGREKDYIILSCVRSGGQAHGGIGFVKDARRLNVSLTRAKRGIVIIGNPTVLSRSPIWNDLVWHFQQEGALMTGSSLHCLQPITVVGHCMNYQFDPLRELRV